MASVRETVLSALLEKLKTLQGRTVVRNEEFPQRIPSGGIVILRDGEAGEPDVTLSPVVYEWTHIAELEVAIQHQDGAQRDVDFDNLVISISTLLSSDPTLGGVCMQVTAQPPDPNTLPVQGGASIKAATMPIELIYTSTNPVG